MTATVTADSKSVSREEHRAMFGTFEGDAIAQLYARCMYRIALAITLAALGCEKASSPKASGSGGHACPREEFERWWIQLKSVSIPYFGAIQDQVPRWSNCETARIDLIALAPLSSEYERVMRLNLEWMHLQGGACDD
ncbi:MAG: hypothetical protein ACKV2T_22430 [Kofleriaceae bacterium]